MRSLALCCWRPRGNSEGAPTGGGGDAEPGQLEAARFICAIWDNSGGQATWLTGNKEAFINFVNLASLKMKSLESALAERRHHKHVSTLTWWCSHKRKQKKVGGGEMRVLHNDYLSASVLSFLAGKGYGIKGFSVSGSRVHSLQYQLGMREERSLFVWSIRAPDGSLRQRTACWSLKFLRISQHLLGALPVGMSWISLGRWNKASIFKTNLEDRPIWINENSEGTKI